MSIEVRSGAARATDMSGSHVSVSDCAQGFLVAAGVCGQLADAFVVWELQVFTQLLILGALLAFLLLAGGGRLWRSRPSGVCGAEIVA